MRLAIEASWRHVSQPGWPRPDDALELLRDHIAVDYESLAINAFRIVMDQATRRHPEDDRVWLAQANLAIRTGEYALRGSGSMIALRSDPRTLRSGKRYSIGRWAPRMSTRSAKR